MMISHYRIRCLLLAVLLFSLLVIVWLIQPFICETDYTICFFRTVTGKPCVFCGLTRALAYASHGNFDSAFACHKFWWLAALIIIVIASISMVDAVVGTSVLRRLRAICNIPAWFLAGIVIILTLVRLLFFSPT